MSNSTTSDEGAASLDTSNSVMSLTSVEFVSDVDAFMAEPENDNNAQNVLRRLEETYSKLKMSEANNVNTKRRLNTQLAEFDNSLKMLAELKRRRDEGAAMTTQFRLADHVFAQATIPPADKIGLWLGASVMLEYSLEEGEALLKAKNQKAEKSLEMTNVLIDSLRENITTLEVNMARIFNWDVKRRQLEKEKAGIAGGNTKMVGVA